jgi:hypothetical protein
MGASKPSSPITTLLNCTSCLKDVVGGGGGGDEAEDQDFTRGLGTNFDRVATSQMVVKRESLWESSV